MAARPQELRLELHCLDRRCGTLLPRGAEICDECGGTALGQIGHNAAVLFGEAGDRPIGFGLAATRPNVIGRASRELDIDLARCPGSESVHRRHAEITAHEGTWSVAHLGRNPLVVSRPAGTVVVQPGTTCELRSGDWLQVGRIRLHFIVGRGARAER
ncbi:MAG: FHA domain-containing protein [Chloroflexi bacterium]|nr:FHA domain-containing protein [Chloroflexota bacterium]MBV9602527.1 FHA domain-containing protein [Chloroflexota bacterium]